MKYSKDATVSYFDSVADSYSEDSYGYDNPNAYRLEIVKGLFQEIPKGNVLDAGCGAGDLLCYLASQGYGVAGTDISPNMVKVTQNQLSSAGVKDAIVETTPLSELSCFANDHFDVVTALGVLPYIPEDEEGSSYKEITRVLKPGGTFIAAYQNELFDVLTFNRYTMRFFKNNIFPVISNVAVDLDLEGLERRLEGLVTHPDKPTLNDEKAASQRGHVFTRPENPVTLPDKFSEYGLKHIGNYYYNFHALPPLILNEDPSLKGIGRLLEIKYAQHWLGMFMASTFVTVAKLER